MVDWRENVARGLPTKILDIYYRLPCVFGARSSSQLPFQSQTVGTSTSSTGCLSYSPSPSFSCLEDWFLRCLCLLLLATSAASMALPWQQTIRSSSKPRWVNPCDLPGHVFDPSTDMEGAPAIRLSELFNSVKERARVAKEHAAHVKENFLRFTIFFRVEKHPFLKFGTNTEHFLDVDEFKHNRKLKLTFDDADFVPGIDRHRQNWLPNIPAPKEKYFRSITKEEAFRKSFEFLQFFAVGIEQIILDQVIHDGHFVSLFREVENHLTQVLCELQLGLFTLRIPMSADVMRDVMSQEYRDIGGRSRRNVRDYLILRDYVKAAQFVAELFAYLERTL